MIIATNILLNEIESAFPFTEMSLDTDLLFYEKDFFECHDLLADIEQDRGKEITGNAIRVIHQEMSHLSAKTWEWVLPHYPRFCFTAEAEYNRMETEFLIYSLAPSLEFQAETWQRLSLLNINQINCLIHFLEWCSNHQCWKEYCPDGIDRGINF